MATVQSERIQIDGTQPTYNAASGGGDKVAPGDDVHLHVKNGDASEHTVTIVTPGTVAGQAIGDVAVAVPAGEEVFIGPLVARHFEGDDGLVSITWSATTGMTFAAIRG